MAQSGLKKGIHLKWIILMILVILLTAVIIILLPWNISNIASHSQPAQSYDEAIQAIAALNAREPADMNPVCRTQLMDHQKKTGRVIVMVHGYTNCPQQFHALGQRFYDLGYNVLIAPLPYHGLAERMNDIQSQLKAEDLASYADETLNIAHGLGDQVDMLGISAGGVTTAWAAQNRSDIQLAVMISPAFGFKQIPTPLTAAVMNVYIGLPDGFEWWDPVLKSDAPPAYTYPRYSKHALVQTLRLGFATQALAQQKAPAAKQLLVVLNANDDSVNNALTQDVIKTWQAHGANLTTFTFDASLNLIHDMIDPAQSLQKVDMVYPKLIDLVNR